jgi:hypothetical protein
MAFTAVYEGWERQQPGVRTLRNKLIVLAAIFGLLAASGVAYADTDDDNGQEPDTTFNFGYDEENGVFVWGASDSDGLYDCTLENGALDATYVRVPEGHLLVEDLQDGDDPVEFEANPEHEDFEELEEEDHSVAYADLEECAVSGDLVAGPEGQINHGMFLRLFNLMYDGPARGCLVRHIAQSDLGKDDQQVNVPEAEAEADTEDPVSGSIEFETVMTKCNHGPAVLADSDDESGPPAHAARPDHAGPPEHAGKPDDVGPPDHARGNSDAAPGRNP